MRRLAFRRSDISSLKGKVAASFASRRKGCNAIFNCDTLGTLPPSKKHRHPPYHKYGRRRCFHVLAYIKLLQTLGLILPAQANSHQLAGIVPQLAIANSSMQQQILLQALTVAQLHLLQPAIMLRRLLHISPGIAQS